MKKVVWVHIVVTVIAVAYLLNFSGCAGTHMAKCKDHPEWVEKGGGIYGGDRGSAIYGVGTANQTGNITSSLLKKAADTRARADVAASIMTRVEELVKSYQGYITDTEASEVEEWVRIATVGFTQMDLGFTPIVDRHYCPRDKGYHALARMDVSLFMDTMDEIEDLENFSENAKSAIKEHAQEVFDELADRTGEVNYPQQG
jgi:hypothetical protein